MNNKPRVQEFKKKLFGLQIESSNNSEKFNKECENDFRRLLGSIYKLLLKGNNHSGGKFTGLNILNSYLDNNGKFKVPTQNVNNNNNLSQKSTVNNPRNPILPNVYNNNNLSQKSTVNNPRNPILPNVNNNNNLSQKSTVNNPRNLILSNVNANLLKESKIKEPPKKPMSKERILHECQIYEYLQKKSQNFINTSTCFVRCSDDSLFLRNCGITFEELILENKNNFNLFRYILEQLLRKIHDLHLLGVVHNNLICSHVLVGKRDNINWRYMSNNKLKSKKEEEFLNIPFVRKNIDVRLINFSKAKIFQSSQKIDKDFLNGIFYHYTRYAESLFSRST